MHKKGYYFKTLKSKDIVANIIVSIISLLTKLQLFYYKYTLSLITRHEGKQLVREFGHNSFLKPLQTLLFCFKKTHPVRQLNLKLKAQVNEYMTTIERLNSDGTEKQVHYEKLLDLTLVTLIPIKSQSVKEVCCMKRSWMRRQYSIIVSQDAKTSLCPSRLIV